MQQHLRTKHNPAGRFVIKNLAFKDWAIHLCSQAIQDRLLLLLYHFTDQQEWTANTAKEWMVMLQRRKLDEAGGHVGWLPERYVIVKSLLPINDKGNCGLFPTTEERAYLDRQLEQLFYQAGPSNSNMGANKASSVQTPGSGRPEELGDQGTADLLSCPSLAQQSDAEQLPTDPGARPPGPDRKDPAEEGELSGVSAERTVSQEVEMVAAEDINSTRLTRKETLLIIQEAKKQQDLIWRLLERELGEKTAEYQSRME